MSGKFAVLGNRVPRKDAIEKVNGQVRYVADIHLQGMLYAKFLRSPHAHARIKSIDTSKAEELPGVKCVLTHKNVLKVHVMKKLEYLLGDTVNHPGAEVAAVAALTAGIAEEALKLIDVEYEILPAIFDVEEAIKPGATLARQDYGTNLWKGSEHVQIPRLEEDGWLRLEVGDIEKGFSEADYILDATSDTPIQYCCSPTTRNVVCEWSGNKLTAWVDSQEPLYTRQDLANCLEMPQSNIRLISQYSVGGYGAKRPEKTATLTAIMARRTGRPVKASFSRTEDFIGTHRRISFRNYNKVGVKKDGTITSMYSRILANWGNDSHVPYISQGSAVSHACNMLYRWQNSKGETCGVLTNTNAYGAMNGFGDPEEMYSIERLMDEAAEKIDMDPVDFRYMNCMRYGDKAIEMFQVLNGPIEWGVLGPDLDSFPELIKSCSEKANWKEQWKGWRTPVAVNGYRNKGIGVAIGMHHTAVRPSSAIVKMNQDGSATVMSGAVEIGQGLATAMSLVVAEVLGISYDNVNPVLADTWATPTSMGVFASGGTSSEVNAAKLAADDVKIKLCELAAPGLNESPDNLELKNSRIYVRGTENYVSIADVCLHNFQITGTANNPPYHIYRDEKTGKVIHAYAAAVTFVEIEVDMETGKIYVERITSGHDCGTAINPTIVENQIDLGLTMANGWVRSEEYIIDPKTGIMMNPNLLDYKLMTFLDMPERDNFQKIVVEKPCAWGPFGAKGFSETAMTALGPAIANAVYNATGVRMYCASLTPENLLRELGKRGREE